MCAHAGERLTEAALAPRVSLEEISEQLRELPKIIVPSRQARGLAAVTANAFLEMELPAREMILHPVLATQSLSLLYSKRGVGKTFFAVIKQGRGIRAVAGAGRIEDSTMWASCVPAHAHQYALGQLRDPESGAGTVAARRSESDAGSVRPRTR